MTKYAAELDTASAVLASARASGGADRAEAGCCGLRWTWAAMHSTDSIDDAATIARPVRRHRDAGRG